MRTLMTFGAIATLLTLGACKDAGEDKVEVTLPTVGTTQDTLKLPDVDLPDSAVVPDVDVNVGRDTVPVDPR